ncbi:MAG: metal-dependent transcriptional regulator [Treponema sp.]|nr:metal-dependent transcriptional regulator [Treponema sp.]MDY5124067.1 metal-dependent transcriptional regulator [Treponema sp.]
MQIRESAEMYLETILVLSKKGPVRSIDIAKEMNFSRPSVSVTVHNLEKENYIHIEDDGTISLEEKGREIAERIYERHTVLSALLESIGVSKETASEDACKIEHDISVETFECIKKVIAGHNLLKK